MSHGDPALSVTLTTPDLGQLEPRACQHLPPLAQRARMVQAQAGQGGSSPSGDPSLVGFPEALDSPSPPTCGAGSPWDITPGDPQPRAMLSAQGGAF